MDQYVTGSIIKKLREKKGLTQYQLAEMLNVSDKTVSKWETGKGYPDITLIEPIAAALGISVIELLSGENITNMNRSADMKRVSFYVCPICGNVIASSGECIVSCCGLTLPPLEPEESDGDHKLMLHRAEDEYYAEVKHEMTKEHYISFIAGVTDGSVELVRMYPEGEPGARLKIRGLTSIYYYCDHHGLFRAAVR